VGIPGVNGLARALLLGTAILFAGCASVSSASPPGLSDAAMTAAVISNVNYLGGDAYAAIRRNPDGSPDMAVTDGVLIVVTMNPDTAATLCRSVAAITNDPATSKPLGILSVAVISGGHKLADCRP
jgi:hypothetical protein